MTDSMGTAESILRELETVPSIGVREVCVGRKYTAVTLHDGGVGVALTQLPEPWGCCNGQNLSGVEQAEEANVLARAAERLRDIGWSVGLVRLLTSADPVEAAAALACVNALVNRADVPVLPGDLLQHLRVESSDSVGMVGFFGPLVGPLRTTAARLHIFERKNGDETLLPAEAAFEILPRCDIAIITSGTITNGTIDRLLQAASSCREVAMVGASTPFLPEAFRDSPVSWLSGSVVVETEATVSVIAAGGGRREFNSYLRKGNVPCNGSAGSSQ